MDNTPKEPGFLIIAAMFLLLWLAGSAWASWLGGWSALARRFAMTAPFAGTKWGWQTAYMRWWAHYKGILTLGVTPKGMYLAVFPLFRFRHPPLLIPWSEIRVRRTKFLFLEYCELHLGREMEIPLRLRKNAAAKLQAAAGTWWPLEET